MMTAVDEAVRRRAHGLHLGLALAGNALQRIAAGASGVLVGLYLARLAAARGGVGAGLAGTLGAAAFGAELAAAVPFGVLADIASPRRIMALGCVLGGLAVQGFGLTTVRPVFLLCRAAEGVGAAAVAPPLLAHLTQATRRDPALQARAMSYFELSLLGGIALGGLFGAELWARLQSRAFAGVALAYGVAAVLLYLGTPATSRASESRTVGPTSDLVRALRNPQLRRLAPAWLCMNAIVGLWLGPTLSFLLTRQPLTPQFLDGVFATDPGRVGWTLLGYSIVFGTGVAAWSRVLPRMALPRALRVTLLAMLAASGELLVFNHIESATARWLLGAATALTIMIESGFSPAALALLAGALRADAGRGGAAMGVYSALLGVGALLGSLLAAALGAAFGVDGLIYGTAALAVVALLALQRLAPNARTGERESEPPSCETPNPTTSS